MKENIKISDFSAYLFWDVDLNNFDLNLNKKHLTYKVVEFGQLSDWQNLLTIYGKEEVKSIVLELRSLDPVTLSFLANYFHLEEKDFRCYTEIQSKKSFWNS